MALFIKLQIQLMIGKTRSLETKEKQRQARKEWWAKKKEAERLK
jgi:hypothetical protein